MYERGEERRVRKPRRERAGFTLDASCACYSVWVVATFFLVPKSSLQRLPYASHPVPLPLILAVSN